MKCPVCNSNCSEKDEICKTCGFTELKVEFINEDEAKLWERTVLKPCRALWNASENMYKVALNKMNKIASNKNIDAAIVNTDSNINVKCNIKDTGTGEWIEDDLVSHLDAVTCRYKFGGITCRMYNIESQVGADGNIYINYLLKKCHDKKGSNSVESVRYRYKIKDPDGVIIENDFKIVYGLKVGDVSRETLVINNPLSGGYSIDFVDME